MPHAAEEEEEEGPLDTEERSEDSREDKRGLLLGAEARTEQPTERRRADQRFEELRKSLEDRKRKPEAKTRASAVLILA